ELSVFAIGAAAADRDVVRRRFAVASLAGTATGGGRSLDDGLVVAGEWPDGRARSLRGRPRAWPRRSTGGRAETQGDLRPARRSVQQRRSDARADGDRRQGFSGTCLRAGRRQ